ncbi:nickel ABC transporter permease [Candidatus Bipolaricaulota bacterium]
MAFRLRYGLRSIAPVSDKLGGAELLAYIVRRILITIPVVFLVSFLAFMLLSMVPGDPVELMLTSAYGEAPTQERIDIVRKELGFDRPLHVQYITWLGNAVQGDLGVSMKTGHPLIEDIARTLPASLELAFSGMFLGLLIAFPTGIISATKKNRAVDYICRTGSLLGISMPSFWLAILLMLLFSVRLQWLPVFGRGGIEHLILPAITLGLARAAMASRLIRSNMLEILGQDYIVTARAKGVRESAVVWKHALKGAMAPVITIIALQLGYTLGSSVIVETVFAWPGMGRLLVEAIFARDFVTVQGATLVFALIIIVLNLLVDISYVYFDPRVKYD